MNRRTPHRSSDRPAGSRPSAARTHSGSARAHSNAPRAEPLRPSGEAPAIESFREFELEPTVLAAIEAMGIVKPTPIQALAIGPALQGKDLIAKAETGTGKTLAFGAPMMSKIDPSRSSVLGLVLCPTRELAQQVAGVLEKLGEPRAIKVALLVGGEPIHPQIAALKQGAQVVVGTPGRVIDLYGQRFLSFPWTEFAVLDEADQMLEIGFIDDVKKILSFTPDERQTMLFSATFPDAVLQLARESTRNPIEIATAKGVATVKSIDQSFIRVSRDEQSLALIRLIEQSEPDDVFLVFCDKRTYVDALMRRLERLPFSVKALHGGYDQAARFRVMSAFRTGEVKALVATDVASRGLDVAHVTHVVNFGVPQDISDYTHRIGRTGRAGRTGVAITLVTPEAERRWHSIERSAPWKIREVDPPGRYRVRPRTSDDEPRTEARRDEATREGAAREAVHRGGEREREHGARRDEARGERGPRGAERRPGRDRERETSRSEPRGEAEHHGAREGSRRGERDDARQSRRESAEHAPARREPRERAARSPHAGPHARAGTQPGARRDARPEERPHGTRPSSGDRTPRSADPDRAARAPRRDDTRPSDDAARTRHGAPGSQQAPPSRVSTERTPHAERRPFPRTGERSSHPAPTDRATDAPRGSRGEHGSRRTPSPAPQERRREPRGDVHEAPRTRRGAQGHRARADDAPAD